MTRPRLSFYLGMVAGFVVCLLISALLTVSRTHTRRSSDSSLKWRSGLPDPRDLAHAHGHAHAHAQASLEGVHGVSEGGLQDAREVRFEDEHAHHDDDSEAREMAKRVRVLVWVMTSPDNLDKKAVHVRNTWGKRANALLFMSSQWNSSFPTVGLNVSEGRQHLTAKTMQAFRYVYEHHFHDADWFMKADDDTYVIMENLRYMLSSHDPQDPVYFGHAFKVIVKQGYASGGAGYVLSKEALKRLVTRSSESQAQCRKDGGAEDAEVGKCLMNLGVKLKPSVDRLGRSRFHCFGPEAHLQGFYPDWYLQYDANGANKGMESISDYPVSFHYIPPRKMYEMEFFVYHLRPYGIISRAQALNLPQDDVHITREAVPVKK